MCVCVCVRVRVCVCARARTETDLSQRFDAGSPHLPWDHPFYDIARHQIIEVAGQSSNLKPFSPIPTLTFIVAFVCLSFAFIFYLFFSRSYLLVNLLNLDCLSCIFFKSFIQWKASILIQVMLNSCLSFCVFVGDDNFGRKVIVFNACRMPPQHQLDHHKLLM